MYTAQGFANKTRVKKAKGQGRGGLVIEVDFMSSMWLVLWDGTTVPQKVYPGDCAPEIAPVIDNQEA